jgi:hypothetical protein
MKYYSVIYRNGKTVKQSGLSDWFQKAGPLLLLLLLLLCAGATILAAFITGSLR